MKQIKLWKTKDGNKIRVCDMTDSHLKNAIAFLERNANHYALQKALKFLDILQGEMAIALHNDHMFDMSDIEDDVRPGEIWPIYDSLLLERDQRGLDNI